MLVSAALVVGAFGELAELGQGVTVVGRAVDDGADEVALFVGLQREEGAQSGFVDSSLDPPFGF